MGWNNITTAEIAPRQPLDAELFGKIRNNLIVGFSAIGLPQVIPNGSFEHSTGVVPLLWSITSHTGGSASISTGVHGAKSLRITHPGSSGNGGAEVWTEDYITVGSSIISIHGYVWASGTAVKGGVAVHTYDSTYGILSTVSTNHSSYTSTPTSMTMTFAIGDSAKFVKVGCVCGTDSTVAGTINFDGLYIVNT